MFLGAVTCHDCAPCSSLRQVLACQEDAWYFRCLVRVIDIWPPEVEQSCFPTSVLLAAQHKFSHNAHPTSPNPPLEECHLDSGARGEGEVAPQGDYFYSMIITLEDPTGRLRASLAKDEAVRHFAYNNKDPG